MCINLRYKILKGPLYNRWGTFTDFQNGHAISIRCGSCYKCLILRSFKWQNRLLLEAEWHSLHSGFLYFVKKQDY